MNFVVKFAETSQSFGCQFGEVNNISDDSYKRGYAEGYEVGNSEGHQTGYSEGYGDAYNEAELVEKSFIDRTLTEIKNDKVTSIGAQAFAGFAALKTIEAPNVTSVGNRSFSQSGITRVVFPKLTSVGGDAFTYCYSLTYADMGNVSSLPSWCFASCTALTTLILRKTSIVTLTGINALNSTAIAKGTGYVYVPDNLVEQYKAAANWSTYAAQIKPLSELVPV